MAGLRGELKFAGRRAEPAPVRTLKRTSRNSTGRVIAVPAWPLPVTGGEQT